MQSNPDNPYERSEEHELQKGLSVWPELIMTAEACATLVPSL